MRSIEKISQDEKEIKVLISSLKNVLTDVPYDFVYVYDNIEDDEEDNDEYFD